MELKQLAVPASYTIVSFLGYTPQVLFLYLEPGPLTKNELITLNGLLICIFIAYTKSAFVNPGGIPIISGKVEGEDRGELNGNIKGSGSQPQTKKWCRRCEAPKPPRAHHCKECKRCIPKMDHHCPWTGNCVSHTTFPHFIRFLSYSTITLILMETFLWARVRTLWANRDLPSYLGPTPLQLAHLFILMVANSIALFAIFILCVRNIWCLAVNTTTIEGWEIERHRTLVKRARHFGGWLEGPDGERVRIGKQEFPYDIGIWKNIVQGMGTGNPLAWLNPFSSTPPIETGLSFETNGFENPSLSWPPPDPDRSYRRYNRPSNEPSQPFTYQDSGLSPEEQLKAFKKRQAADVVRRRRPFVERLEAQVARESQPTYDNEDDQYGSGGEEEEEVAYAKGNGEGEESWRNSEGERLGDFGVDEDIEFYDEQEDDIPLSELMARRRGAASSTSANSKT